MAAGSKTDPKQHKLQSPSVGPFQVIDYNRNTVTIEYPDGTVEKISRDRAVKAPGPPNDETVDPPDDFYDRQAFDDPDERPVESAIRTTGPDTEPDRFVVERITAYDEEKDLFTVKWHGYPDEDTEEPPAHIPYNLMAKYFKSKGKRVPRHLLQYRSNA